MRDVGRADTRYCKRYAGSHEPCHSSCGGASYEHLQQRARTGFWVVAADQFLWANHRLIIDLAARYRIPTICAWLSYVDEVARWRIRSTLC